MKIGTKERLVTGTGLAVIAIIAAMIWWTYSEVEDANRQRRVTTEIGHAVTELRLITFEYNLHRNERARVQWIAVSDHVDQLIAHARFRKPEQSKILAGLREKRAAGLRLFTEITAADYAGRADTPLLVEASGRREAQQLSQLMVYQQENFADALRLTDLATQRIMDAEWRVMIATLAGLALIAASIVATSWFLRRGVLVPIAQLQQATRQVAAGNWNVVLDIGAKDEIGELSKNFGVMTQSLQASFAQVERSNLDLAALNTELEAFSYSVSHDLRGPLRSMDGFSLVLLEDYGDLLDEEGKDALQRIRVASQRMGSLIDDLLRLSKVTRADLNMTQIDLSAIARDIADALDREQPDRATKWDIQPGLSADADLALTRIALQNLLQNAWKFTGRSAQPVIRFGALERESKTVFFVADNGVGFDMAHAANLFGAFQRLHHVEDFPGTGIGLAIVQRIIRRLGGNIWAEARKGQGATFFFTLKESKNGPNEQDHPAG